MNPQRLHPYRRSHHRRLAFSLMEVMIAIGIFFMVAFSVLALVSRCLRQARALELVRTPIGAIASDAMITTPIENGLYSGDFGDIYPDYKWQADVYDAECATNETLKVIALEVTQSGQSKPQSELLILKFQPGRPQQEEKGAFWE